jgi:hypothetical protein
MKIRKTQELMNKEGVRGGHTTEVSDILPFLPDADCFFDCRHFVYELTENFLPFALTTRTAFNNQQYLKIYEATEDNSIGKL